MEQPLTAWDGDLASLITEMKRRARVRTDQELARFLGVAQSTVSGWRKRDAVPEAALLRFEAIYSEPQRLDQTRLFTARTIALRLPELWYDRFKARSPSISRRIFYAILALNLGGVSFEIAERMRKIEGEQSIATEELGNLLFDDAAFLNALLDWMTEIPMSEMLARTMEAADFFERLDQ